jgi:hypothetical protein
VNAEFVKQSLAGPARASARTVHARFQTRDQQEIDDLNRTIGETDTDGSTCGCLAHEFRMIDGKRATVGQMDVEGPKWASPEQFLQCLDGHGKYPSKA